MYYADHITAVSPTYAREITEPQFAYGMEGLLRQRHLEGRLSGILNGVDEKIWNPESDLLLASRYTRDTLEEKAENKRQLQIAMGLKVNDKVPLFAVVSRLTNQKGLDLVLEALPGLLEQGGQLALLGAGDPVLQEGFLAAAAEHPGQVGVQIGYHEAFSHRIMGGADVILVPSRFEPCGLTQLYGLKYGTLPLVRRTGGWPIRSPTVRWKIWRTVSPAVLSLKTVMPGRCYARFGVLLCCGHGLRFGGLYNGRRWRWILAGKLPRNHTASCTIA